MEYALAFASLVLALLVLTDCFEAMVLPRRVTRGLRPARLYYRTAWKIWSYLARRRKPGPRRELFLSLFGPLSLFGLFVIWVVGLIFSFGVLHWSLKTALHISEGAIGFGTYLYLSGTTFFTLGYGDVTPVTAFGRFLAVVESGLGFGFMAVIIAYLPVLYQAFSHREIAIGLLDARAGSPPSAAQFLLRASRAGALTTIDSHLSEWERWSAELLESHLSYPFLSYYRSQHDNQSWLAALTAILDSCTILIVAVEERDPYQAQLTFAMARHAAVDLALVFRTPPSTSKPDRLPPERCLELRQLLRKGGLVLREGEPIDKKLRELRDMYEPFLHALADYFIFTLPAVLPEKQTVDNWQTSAWMRRAPGIDKLHPRTAGDDHFD
jgi:hypothetical protein